MKKPKIATPLDETVILVKKGPEWECRYWSRPIGAMPLGPRLARKESFPQMPVSAKTRMEAVELQTKWQQWIDARPERKFKK